jgi:AcrR family transcriptional regulator
MATAPVRQPATRRGAILDSAARQFASHGFEGASLREIAADAGLKNQASLYQYFPDKRALYEAAIGAGIDAMLGRLGRSSPGASVSLPRDRPRASSYLDDLIDHFVENPHIARLIQGAGNDASPFVREALPRLLQPLYEEGLRLLTETDGGWAGEDVPHLAAALYHLIFGYFANPALMEVVLGADPNSADALTRQRRFLKIAVTRLIGEESTTSVRSAAGATALA